uniref:Uncharacterized protein n=1 Tax=viral metagenome TaxID=1070528 RepID=A0A6M3J442_9ZZZZ
MKIKFIRIVSPRTLTAIKWGAELTKVLLQVNGARERRRVKLNKSATILKIKGIKEKNV